MSKISPPKYSLQVRSEETKAIQLKDTSRESETSSFISNSNRSTDDMKLSLSSDGIQNDSVLEVATEPLTIPPERNKAMTSSPSAASQRRTSSRIQGRIKAAVTSPGKSPSSSGKAKRHDNHLIRMNNAAIQQRVQLPVSSLKSSENPTEAEALANILFAYNLRSPLAPGEDKQVTSNPFSLFAIGEAGSKRLGVWKKTPDLFNLLAVEYSEPLRRCRYVGLRNLGATCYMNSYLQTLFMNLDFRAKLFTSRKLQVQSAIDSTSKLSLKDDSLAILPELQLLFTALQSGMTQAADPGGVAKALRIATENQEDATEFATLLLMALERELGGTKSTLNFIPELFRGHQTQSMVCESCGNISQRTDDFYELRVRVPHQTTYIAADVNGTSQLTSASKKKRGGTGKKKKNEAASEVQPRTNEDNESIIIKDEKLPDNVSSVTENDGSSVAETSPTVSRLVPSVCEKLADIEKEEASSAEPSVVQSTTGSSTIAAGTPVFHLEKGLLQLFQSEQLRGDNRYMCSQCNSKVDALRRISLASLPPYLHICFERYTYDGGGRKKLTAAVDYPLTLSLKEFVTSPSPPRTNGVEIKEDKITNSANECYELQSKPDSCYKSSTDQSGSLPSVSNAESRNPLVDEDEYELIGVLEHHGTSAQSGHYVAYLRDMSVRSEGTKIGTRRVLLKPFAKGLAPGKTSVKAKARGNMDMDGIETGRKRRANFGINAPMSHVKKRKDAATVLSTPGSILGSNLSGAPSASTAGIDEEARRRRVKGPIKLAVEEMSESPRAAVHRKRKKGEMRALERIDQLPVSGDEYESNHDYPVYLEPSSKLEDQPYLSQTLSSPQLGSVEKMREQSEKERLDEALSGGNLPPRKKPRYHPNHPKVVEAPGAHRTISHKARSHLHTGYGYYYGPPARYPPSTEMMFPLSPELYPTGPPPPSEFTDPTALYYLNAPFGLFPPLFSGPGPMFPPEFFPPPPMMNSSGTTAASTQGVPISPPPSVLAPPPTPVFGPGVASPFPVVPGTLVTQSTVARMKSASDKSPTAKHLVLSPIGLPPIPAIPSSPLLSASTGLSELAVSTLGATGIATSSSVIGGPGITTSAPTKLSSSNKQPQSAQQQSTEVAQNVTKTNAIEPETSSSFSGTQQNPPSEPIDNDISLSLTNEPGTALPTTPKIVGWVTTATTRLSSTQEEKNKQCKEAGVESCNRTMSSGHLEVSPVSLNDNSPADVSVTLSPEVVGVGPRSVLGPDGLAIRPAGVVTRDGNNMHWVGTGRGLSGGCPPSETVMSALMEKNTTLTNDEHDYSPLLMQDTKGSEEHQEQFQTSAVDSELSNDSLKSPHRFQEFLVTDDQNGSIASRISAHKRQVSVPVHSLLAAQSDDEEMTSDQARQGKCKKRMTKYSKEATDSTRQHHALSCSPQVPNGNSLDRRWEWVAFDDASVSEWKIQTALSTGVHLTLDNKSCITSTEENNSEKLKNSHNNPLFLDSGRLTSRTAYLLIYKKKSWNPAPEPVPPKIMEDAVTAVHSKIVQDGDKQSLMAEQISNFAVQRKEEVNGMIKEMVRASQVQSAALREKLYSPSNENPLFDVALRSMVCVPMSWWGAFICGYDFPSLATTLPSELRPTRDPSNPNAAGPPALTAAMETSKVPETEVVDYSDVLCLHCEECAGGQSAEIQRWRPSDDETSNNLDDVKLESKTKTSQLPSVVKSENGHDVKAAVEKISSTPETIPDVKYGNPCGIDPLAVWDGKVKIIAKEIISTIFSKYRLTASIPDISLSKVVCSRCSNSFSQLMEYLFDQWATLAEMIRFTKVLESPSSGAPTVRKTASASTNCIVNAELTPPPILHEVLTWVSRKTLTDIEARFSVRDRTKKTPEGCYDVYCAAEDGRKEINKLRELCKQKPQRRKSKPVAEDGERSHFFPATASSPESIDGTLNGKLIAMGGNINIHPIDFVEGVVCPHGALLPGKKPSSKVLVSKEKLSRFLEVEELRLELLINDFGISDSVAMSCRTFASGFVDVVNWSLDASQQCIALPPEESVEMMKCLQCETELSREKQRAQEWRQKVDEEKLKIGEYIYRRSCKLIKPQDSRRYAPWCLAEGRHYLVPSQWIESYFRYLSAKDAESAVFPGVLDGSSLLLRDCPHDHQPRLAFDPVSYLLGPAGITLHPKENTKHPEWEIYQLVHESEFEVLQQIYGSIDVQFFNVRFTPTISTEGIVSQQDAKPNHTAASITTTFIPQFDYDGSALPCPECVRACRFASGGVGDFENVALRLKVDIKATQGRQFGRRHQITVDGSTEIRHLVEKVVAMLALPAELAVNGQVQFALEGPVTSPFYQPETLISKSESGTLSSSASSNHRLGSTSYCRLLLHPDTFGRQLRELRTQLEDGWYIHVTEGPGIESNNSEIHIEQLQQH